MQQHVLCGSGASLKPTAAHRPEPALPRADAESFPRRLRITDGSGGYSAIVCGLAAGPLDCAVAYNNDDDAAHAGRKVTLALFASADVR